jgi:orotate phosphoribosyltransferase
MNSETGAVGRQVARLLVSTGAIHFSRHQPFILAAGWASPAYVDCRLLIGESDVRHAITELTAQFVAAAIPDPLDAVVGAETAGIPFAAWLADETGSLLRHVRKRPLGIGRNAQVEGGAVDGMRVLLVDDLTTDGTSKLAFVRGLRSAGGIVEHDPHDLFQRRFSGRGGTPRGRRCHAACARDLGRRPPGRLRARPRGSRHDRKLSRRSRGLVGAPWRSDRDGGTGASIAKSIAPRAFELPQYRAPAARFRCA